MDNAQKYQDLFKQFSEGGEAQKRQLESLAQLNRALQREQQQLDQLNQEMTRQTSQRDMHQQQKDQLEQQLSEKKYQPGQHNQAWQTLEEKVAARIGSELNQAPPAIPEQSAWLIQQENNWQQWQGITKEQTSLNEQIVNITQQLHHKSQNQHKADEVAHQLHTELDSTSAQWQQQQQKRLELFGHKVVVDERQQLKSRVAEAQNHYQQTQLRLKTLEQHLSQLNGVITQQTRGLEELRDGVNRAELKWQNVLNDSPFADNEHFQRALLDKAERNGLTGLKQQLEQQLHEARGKLASAEASLKTHRENPATTLSLDFTEEMVTEKLAELEQQIRCVNQRQGEITQSLKEDDAKRQRQADLFRDIAAREHQFQVWARLNGLIGSSKGDKFRKFAQGLTLDHLLILANRQLEQLHARYLLNRKSSDELSLEVLDTWQGETARDIKTLSGGESFLVSLALALGLSDLVSDKTRIDSLFLDEGFGTLDQETLETALCALDSLNASGKMVGIISHIEPLKERISTRIEVIKEAGLGYSRLDKRFACSCDG